MQAIRTIRECSSYRVGVLIRWAVSGVLLATLVGCTQSTNAVNGPPTPPHPTHKATPTPTAKPSAKPTRAVRAALPTDCSLLLTSATIDKALGKRIGGQTIYIKGLAQPNIGRTGRTTCRYGYVHGKSAPVEADVSGYASAAQAAARVKVTIAVERSSGATPSSTTIGTLPATMLVGKQGSVIVYATANRTAAVTLGAGVGGAQVATVLKSLAAAMDANLP